MDGTSMVRVFLNLCLGITSPVAGIDMALTCASCCRHAQATPQVAGVAALVKAAGLAAGGQGCRCRADNDAPVLILHGSRERLHAYNERQLPG